MAWPCHGAFRDARLHSSPDQGSWELSRPCPSFPGSASEPHGNRTDLSMEMGLTGNSGCAFTGIFAVSRIIFLPSCGWELLRVGAGAIFPEKGLLPFASLFCWEAQLGGNERHFVAALHPRIFPPFQKIP